MDLWRASGWRKNDNNNNNNNNTCPETKLRLDVGDIQSRILEKLHVDIVVHTEAASVVCTYEARMPLSCLPRDLVFGVLRLHDGKFFFLQPKDTRPCSLRRGGGPRDSSLLDSSDSYRGRSNHNRFTNDPSKYLYINRKICRDWASTGAHPYLYR